MSSRLLRPGTLRQCHQPQLNPGAASSRRRPTSTFPPRDERDERKVILPGIQRIVLVRHGESLGNVDERAYARTADWRIPLTDAGRGQARAAGRMVALHLGHGGDAAETGSVGDGAGPNRSGSGGRVFFYVSPYLRTRQTLREILREVDRDRVVGIREDPRIAEQQFGNFQCHSEIQDNKAERTDFGRFFYRFPDGGESGFDVYNRVSGFIGTMQRDSYHVLESWCDDDPSSMEEGMTICIVTHGLAMRLFLMRWFQYTVHEFERSYNPPNGMVVALEPAGTGGFELPEADRIALGFPPYWEQERFRILDDYGLLDKSRW
ncbi:hypothetical protein ACHAWF_003902 [Thalassiosira exigua]